ncbi:hypothetical protein DPMN_042580 [Dreissena polymorpha]|uniref:Uncharacterized protein n=1 Tax=Dreissena polymorpha TaxID=45954 RepID=A0A9D4CZT3_DREPO|nr:hypothetical protein DPMN_042580 [Dreissena polymorpha]
MFSLYTYRANCPTPWGPCFFTVKTIFELRKLARPLAAIFFLPIWTIFELVRDINETNVLTKFHNNWTKNVTSRVNTAPPPGGHVFQGNIWADIFELSRGINGTNVLTKFHEDRAIYVASGVATTQNVDAAQRTTDRRRSQKLTMSRLCSEAKTIFELVQDIIGTNLLTKFHEDRKINVASRVSTRFCYSHIRKHDPPPCRHVFQPKGIIFEFVQDIIGMNLWTEFHEDWTINVASRVKNAPPHGSHVFQATVTIFKPVHDIIGTNLLTKFHEDRKKMWPLGKNAPPPGCHVFQPNGIIFELVQDIIGMNLLTKFHEDQTINVASRVLTRFYYSHIRKNASPLGSHVFQANVTIFEIIHDIIEFNLLTKFQEDWTINVASRELTR